jgi:hypothetical protein
MHTHHQFCYLILSSGWQSLKHLIAVDGTQNVNVYGVFPIPSQEVMSLANSVFPTLIFFLIIV